MADARARKWLPPAIRIAFGLIWAVDAAFKWSPAFVDHLRDYLSTAGQPGWVAAYISGWSKLVNHDPHLFAYALALAESAVALSLLLGWRTRATCLGGSVLSLVIWSTAEGFGGPYGPGSTDVGTSIAYVLVFLLLWWSDAGSLFSVEAWRRRRGPRRPSHRAVTGVIAVAVTAVALVTAAVVVSTGPTSLTTPTPMDMDGGQMMMPAGGQDSH